MPIAFEGTIARLSGQCVVEEAGELTEWLLADRTRAVDLAACEDMHSAILQTLMALTPGLASAPADATLARWLKPSLGHLPATTMPANQQETSAPAQPRKPRAPVPNSNPKSPARARRAKKADPS